MKDPTHYESLDPCRFGRQRSVALDQMSGLSSVRFALKEIGEETAEPEHLSLILNSVKEIGQSGRCVTPTELKWLNRLHGRFQAG